MVGVIAAAHELAAEPAEQLGMGVLGAFPVPRLFDETATHQAGPDAVGHHLREAFVLRRGDERGEAVARILRVEREVVGDALLGEFREGPMRFDRGAGLEGDLDERLAAAFAELGHRDAAGGGDLDGLGLEERREGEDLLLLRRVGGRIVAARALGLHAEEGGRDDGGLGGHRDVVLRGEAEAGRTARGGASLEAQELGDHQVERLAVDERFVDPPAERARVVERRVEDVRVLGEDVLPVAHLVVGGARVGEQAVDGLGAFVGGSISSERGDLGGRGRHADSVERHAAQEGEVVGQRRQARRERAVFRPGGAFLDPLFDECDVRGGKAMAFRRHHLIRVFRTDAREERALGGLSGHDGGAVALAALEGAGEGVEV